MIQLQFTKKKPEIPGIYLMFTSTHILMLAKVWDNNNGLWYYATAHTTPRPISTINNDVLCVGPFQCTNELNQPLNIMEP